MSIGTRPQTQSHNPVRGYGARKLAPVIEVVEARTLLSGIIAGTVFLDSASDHTLDAADAYVAGATVELFQVGNATPIASQISNAQGGYVFNNLNPGNYTVKEIPPTGFEASGAQAESQLQPSSVQAADTIAVTVPAATVFANYSGIEPNEFETTTDQVNGNAPQVDRSGALAFSLGTAAGGTDLNAGFSAYCLDDTTFLSTNGGDQFQVVSQPITSVTNGTTTIPAANAGRIAFLYNHFGSATLTAVQSSALQLAIWELLYDTGPTADFSSGNFQVLGPVTPTDQATLNAVLAQATTYFNESAGKSEAALLLNATGPQTPGTLSQSLLASGAYNFGVVPNTNPHVTTSSLSGFVLCKDGINDSDDMPIAGDPITLTGTDTSGNVVKMSVVTDSTGFYDFPNLKPGNYSITQTSQPAGVLPGPVTPGSQGGTVLGRIITQIALQDGVDGRNNDFFELAQVVNVTNLSMFGVHQNPTQIVLTLNGPVNAAAAQNPTNYTLIALGTKQYLGSPTNRLVPISSIVYNAKADTITITPSTHLNVHYHYLLSVNLPNPSTCSTSVNFTSVFGRSSVPFFVEHGNVVANPPLTSKEAALDAAVKNKALIAWKKQQAAAAATQAAAVKAQAHAAAVKAASHVAAKKKV
jgi:SdrD B-like domain